MRTLQIKLLPSAEQELLLKQTMDEYISLVNDILDYAIAIRNMPKLSSATVHAPLPSALRDQCRLDALHIWKRTLKRGDRFPVLKRPIAIWNNQNYSIQSEHIALPVWIDGKAKRIAIKAAIPDNLSNTLKSSKLGTLRITRKNGKVIAQIAYDSPIMQSPGNNVMGLDLGIKCPAVSVTTNGQTKFYGNGRRNKVVRRKFDARRKKLGKAKKLSAIRKLGNKEQRWMRDQDHKISRSIVNEAIRNGVGTIKLERLSITRASARKSRKNNHTLHNWSFYRLATFIEYKARLAGINVIYVNPHYTSQTCPICGQRQKAIDRSYICQKCGFHGHRDRIGAANVLAA